MSKQLAFNWDEPESGKGQELTTISVIEEPGKMVLGISPEFPGGIVAYFPDGSYALVFKGEAMGNLLHQMLPLLILAGLVHTEDEGETEEAPSPKVLPN